RADAVAYAVGPFANRQRQADVVGVLEVERDRPVPRVEVLVDRRHPVGDLGRLVPRVVADPGPLHLDDLGAEVAQQPGAGRARQQPAQVEDAHPREGAAAGAAHADSPSGSVKGAGRRAASANRPPSAARASRAAPAGNSAPPAAARRSTTRAAPTSSAQWNGPPRARGNPMPSTEATSPSSGWHRVPSSQHRKHSLAKASSSRSPAAAASASAGATPSTSSTSSLGPTRRPSA